MKPKKASLDTVPTVGYAVEEFTKHGINFCAFDMSGQGRYRNLWEHYYPECEGIIFVVDSTDHLRYVVAKDEFEAMISAPDIKAKRVPIVFFANKMDQANASKPLDIMQKLNLEQLKDKPWHIC